MKLDFRAFAFVITLAAVVNGLRIVRWLTAVAKYHDYFSKKLYNEITVELLCVVSPDQHNLPGGQVFRLGYIYLGTEVVANKKMRKKNE